MWGSPTIQLCSVLPHSCNFAAVMNHNVNIWMLWWSWMTLWKCCFSSQGPWHTRLRSLACWVETLDAEPNNQNWTQGPTRFKGRINCHKSFSLSLFLSLSLSLSFTHTHTHIHKHKQRRETPYAYSVFPAYMYTHHLCAWFLQRSEEGIKSLWTLVSHHVCLGIEPKPTFQAHPKHLKV